ncbi:MAG: DNRLRE domain-containing protein, partial [Pseudomonadota bacterium]
MDVKFIFPGAWRIGKVPIDPACTIDRKSFHRSSRWRALPTPLIRLRGSGAANEPISRRWPLSAALNIIVLLLLQAPQALAVTTLTFTPVADTYVDESFPTKAYGATTTLAVDASSLTQTFLRFELSGLSGMTVIGVRLRMYNTEGSISGGRIWTMSAQDWSESTTWNSRPSIDGQQVGAFGSVSSGASYETPLAIFALTDGPLSLAIDSTSIDRAHWGSREIRVAPRLLLDLVPAAANAPPVAVNDDYETTQSSPLTVAPPGLLGNDT